MSRITALATLSSVQPDDLLPVVDVHDTSMSAAGTTKKATVSSLRGLDPTATDIQPGGTQSAGSAGVPADAGHVHPVPTWIPSDNGLLAACGDLDSASSAATMTAGTVYLVKIPIRQPVTISTLWWLVTTAGTGASSGTFTGLYSPAGTLLTGSSDIAASLAPLGAKPCTLTTPQPLTPAATAFVWAAIVANLATTQPGLGKFAPSSGNLLSMGLSPATYRFAVAGTLQTSLPPSITPSANGLTNSQAFFAGAS